MNAFGGRINGSYPLFDNMGTDFMEGLHFDLDDLAA